MDETNPAGAPTASAREAAQVRNVGAVVAQALLAVGGGAVAGHYAGGDSSAIVVGAVGMFATLVAGYGVSNGVLLFALPFVLARVAHRAVKGQPLSGLTTEGRIAASLAIRAINATLFAGALGCAIVAVFVARAPFARAFAVFALLAFAISRFSRRAREAIQ